MGISDSTGLIPSSRTQTPPLQEDASNNSDRSLAQGENTPAREEEISQLDLEGLLTALQRDAARESKKFGVGVELDIEQRGAYPRFTVTIIPGTKAEIRKLRRYQ